MRQFEMTKWIPIHYPPPLSATIPFTKTHSISVLIQDLCRYLPPPPELLSNSPLHSPSSPTLTVSLSFLSPRHMAHSNGSLRKIWQPTDILSLPQWHSQELAEQWRLGGISYTKDGILLPLGEILVCPAMILQKLKRKARRKVTLADVGERMVRLLCHALHHLLGYTHDHEQDFKQMAQRERQMLQQFYSTRTPYKNIFLAAKVYARSRNWHWLNRYLSYRSYKQ